MTKNTLGFGLVIFNFIMIGFALVNYNAGFTFIAVFSFLAFSWGLIIHKVQLSTNESETLSKTFNLANFILPIMGGIHAVLCAVIGSPYYIYIEKVLNSDA
ncbi:hypothetical protein NB550_23200 [Vibrio parahaemolyticus]|uniref:hypothetical protein n=1 Tax=Vibrio parahaemolyticus TaxID=670 RepID=UPI0004727480|nr:hypothetical protein [Vibrio parahaemolyticus]ELB2939333.1 hypothetical protein [Vibrio alginolyticus]EGR1345675.1 hypothetical protein [Vibrio parahaemolyticus]EIC2576021.1 hypothetical protein [Vibrio parahaemolyticus]EID0039448.1 hypothetical protein [Vibrio parahaemolyticus]EKH9213095.1 hypothetical protein [Vibrio parahaemolyticus]